MSGSARVFLPNTFAVPCTVPVLARANTHEGMQECVSRIEASGFPLIIVGGASNYLFVDPAPEVAVLQPALSHFRYERIGENETFLEAGAGCVWHETVMRTLADGWCGLENLALIPGTVGAAPVQNIGAYGVEVMSRIDAVQALELSTGALRWIAGADCAFAYRDSLFKSARAGLDVITAVRFRLRKQSDQFTQYETLARELPSQAEPYTALQIAEAVIRVRRARLPDPAVLGNAGSFFKNPVVSEARAAELRAEFPDMPEYAAASGFRKLAAAWLIDKAGLRGMRRGQTGTHAAQALVIVNHGGATGAEILAVAQEVRDAVRARFLIALEPEVRIVGGVLQ